jgi:two-component sensor histidine kinase
MLKDKEILLAEVFHRVKNNLNVVTSLLNLKKNSTDNDEVKEALEECRSRVFSMALVHQRIYSSDSIGLNFKQYIENLVFDIGNSLGNDNEVSIQLEADEVILNLNNAIPCGLIVNEVITNAHKYARKENEILKIDIRLKRENEMIILTIQDNGPGISKDVLDSQNTLGFELINSLSDQLNGTSTFENSNGFKYQLAFKQVSQ